MTAFCCGRKPLVHDLGILEARFFRGERLPRFLVFPSHQWRHQEDTSVVSARPLWSIYTCSFSYRGILVLVGSGGCVSLYVPVWWGRGKNIPTRSRCVVDFFSYFCVSPGGGGW